VAEAAIEERQLLKSLRWYDGFVIALCNPGFLIGSLGFSVGALGGWGATALWGISATIGLLLELDLLRDGCDVPAAVRRHLALAHEGWRRYFSLVGPVGDLRVLDRLGRSCSRSSEADRRPRCLEMVSQGRRATSTSASATTISACRT